MRFGQCGQKGECDGDRPLEGRHALITGGGTGIGAATAELLHAAGARGVAARTPARTASGRRPQSGGTAIQCDVTDLDSIPARSMRRGKPTASIDLLIVNAGIADSAPFPKMTRDSWDRIIAVNLTAAFDTVQAAATAIC